MEDTIKISTPLRTQIALELKIVNPADVEITFTVDFNDEELSGAREIKLAAHDERLYQLVFSPCKIS